MVRPRKTRQGGESRRRASRFIRLATLNKSPRKRRIIIRFLQQSGRNIVIFQREIYFRDEKMQYSCTRTFVSVRQQKKTPANLTGVKLKKMVRPRGLEPRTQ